MFATPVELAATMQRDLATLSIESAVRELEAATGRIRGRAQQWISRVVDDAVELNGTGRPFLLLPEIPVESISSLELAGDPLVEDDEFYCDRETGILWRPGYARWLPVEPRVVSVVYTHGRAVIPEDLKTVCLESAARAMGNPRRVASEQVAGSSARYQYATHEAGGALLPSELAIVDDYAGR